jgi:hypothetical protein
MTEGGPVSTPPTSGKNLKDSVRDALSRPQDFISTIQTLARGGYWDNATKILQICEDLGAHASIDIPELRAFVTEQRKHYQQMFSDSMQARPASGGPGSVG